MALLATTAPRGHLTELTVFVLPELGQNAINRGVAPLGTVRPELDAEGALVGRPGGLDDPEQVCRADDQRVRMNASAAPIGAQRLPIDE
jgi:hypothetical protein